MPDVALAHIDDRWSAQEEASKHLDHRGAPDLKQEQAVSPDRRAALVAAEKRAAPSLTKSRSAGLSGLAERSGTSSRKFTR